MKNKMKQDQVDMLGEKCYKCHKGTFKETTIYDDMEGTLHCTKCGEKTKRWKVRYLT